MLGILGILVYDFIFFAIPFGTILFFGVSLFRYCSAVSRNKATPETFSREEIKRRKILLIVASVISGVLVFIVIGFIALISMVVVNM